MATEGINPIMSLTGPGTEHAIKENAGVSKDYDMFLKMLVAQLKNQDPLSPQDPTEYVSQIATFSQVEQLTKMNSGMDKLGLLMGSSLARLDLGYIGMNVETKIDAFNFKGGETEFRYASVGADKLEIIIKDSSGQVVRTIEGNPAGGEQELTWDGLDDAGAIAADGKYDISIKAVDGDGVDVQSVISMRGMVKEVITENGVSVLVYENGTAVDSELVVAVRKSLT